VLSSSWDGRPFGDNRYGRKIGGCAPLRELGPHLTQCGVGRGLPSYQVVAWSIQPFSHNRHGPKIGGVSLWGQGAGSPSETMWPGSRPVFIPSFILILITVWPQYTNATDRTDRTDRQRQRSDSIGRTDLQPVAQKPRCSEAMVRSWSLWSQSNNSRTKGRKFKFAVKCSLQYLKTMLYFRSEGQCRRH